MLHRVLATGLTLPHPLTHLLPAVRLSTPSVVTWNVVVVLPTCDVPVARVSSTSGATLLGTSVLRMLLAPPPCDTELFQNLGLELPDGKLPEVLNVVLGEVGVGRVYGLFLGTLGPRVGELPR